MLDKMNDIIVKMGNMNEKELDTFLLEGAARAEHVLSKVYNENRDFRIVGEEAFYCGEVVKHQFSMTSCISIYTYEDVIDQSQNPLLSMAA